MTYNVKKRHAPKVEGFGTGEEIAAAIARIPEIRDRVTFDAASPQPIVNRGFRRGYWTVFFDGNPYRVFASVSASADWEFVAEHVEQTAARKLIVGGYA